MAASQRKNLGFSEVDQEILLVEDNPDHGELIVHELREVGMENGITWLRDGQQAFDYLFGKGPYEGTKPKKPILIILDIKMPKLDGIGLLEKIKEEEDLRTIPVVMLTTSSEAEDIIRCYELGANSFVTKPVKFSELKKCVREVDLYWRKINVPPLIEGRSKESK